MTVMFKDEAAKATIRGWYDTFREAIEVPNETRIVETPFGPAHVLVAGPEDAPPLVCLHGALASSAHLLPELGDLVKRHRIYAVDVVGQSVMSDDRRLELGDDSYGRWLTAVCDGLGLTKVVLFGVSWGGFAAIRAASVMRERVLALALLVPAGIVSGSAWRGFTEVGWPMLTYRLAPSAARLRRLFDAMFTTYHATWERYFGDAVRSYKMDMRIPPLFRETDVADYRGPVLVMAAEHDVSFPGAALLTRAKELFPRAEVDLVLGAKHCPPFEPTFRARTASRVTTFLNEHGVARDDAPSARANA